MKKSVLLHFPIDYWYDGKLLFEANTIQEVTTENGWAQRWIRRGAVEVPEKVVEQVIEEQGAQETVAPPKKTEETTKAGKSAKSGKASKTKTQEVGSDLVEL